MNREHLLLQIRNLIADKEFAIACANMELSKDGWTCDWNKQIQFLSSDIDALNNAVYKLG